MALCTRAEETQQTLSRQSRWQEPQLTAVEEQSARRRQSQSHATSMSAAARAERPTVGAKLAPAQPAAVASRRSSRDAGAISGVSSAVAAGAGLAGRVAWRQFPARWCPADDARQREATKLTSSDRGQTHVRAAARSRPPAEVGSAPATRTQFPADCAGRQRPEPASALASSGIRKSSQRRAVPRASQTVDSASQLRGSRPASGDAQGPRHSTSTVPARGARSKTSRHRRSRGAAAVPALLALCLLCLAGAPAAAAPIVRAAVGGNAATSMAILVRALSVPHVHSSQSLGLGETWLLFMMLRATCCEHVLEDEAEPPAVDGQLTPISAARRRF